MNQMLNRWVHGDSNRTWSNYTRSIKTKNKSKLILQCNHVLSCVDKEEMSYHTSLNNLHLVGLLVSTALLLLSLVIFTIFPRSVFKVSYQGWTGKVFFSRGEARPKIYEAGGAGQG